MHSTSSKSKRLRSRFSHSFIFTSVFRSLSSVNHKTSGKSNQFTLSCRHTPAFTSAAIDNPANAYLFTSFLATIALADIDSSCTSHNHSHQGHCHQPAQLPGHQQRSVLFDRLSVEIGIPSNGGGGCGNVGAAIQSCYGVAVSN